VINAIASGEADCDYFTHIEDSFCDFTDCVRPLWSILVGDHELYQAWSLLQVLCGLDGGASVTGGSWLRLAFECRENAQRVTRNLAILRPFDLC
jgi:hypothetical protein